MLRENRCMYAYQLIYISIFGLNTYYEGILGQIKMELENTVKAENMTSM